MPDSGAVQGARARRVAHRAWPRTSVWYLLAPHSPHTRPHRLPPPSGRSPSGCSGPPQRSEARRARGGARGPRAREKRATEGPGWSGQGLSRRARPPAPPNAPPAAAVGSHRVQRAQRVLGLPAWGGGFQYKFLYGGDFRNGPAFDSCCNRLYQTFPPDSRILNLMSAETGCTVHIHPSRGIMGGRRKLNFLMKFSLNPPLTSFEIFPFFAVHFNISLINFIPGGPAGRFVFLLSHHRKAADGTSHGEFHFLEFSECASPRTNGRWRRGARGVDRLALGLL